MTRLAAALVLLVTTALASSAAQQGPGAALRTEEFAFEVDGLRLVGLLDRPAAREAGAMIVEQQHEGRVPDEGQGHRWN